MNNHNLNVNHCTKDLGRIFQDSLIFGDHINIMVLNANSKLGIIMNTFND